MKANELMIGDWVKLDFYDNAYADKEDAVWKNGKVTAIHHGKWVDVNFGDTLDECDILVCDIQPIPLTAEILEKNGFRNIGGHWYDDAADYYELEIEAYSDSIWRVIYHNTEFNIGDERVFVSHIHELQHALRLFGIKKEIEL